MEFNPGFDIIPTVNPMGFKYGADVFGPQVENRYLRDIREVYPTLSAMALKSFIP